MAVNPVCKVMQGIANVRPEIVQRIIEKAGKSSEVRDSNLRPSAPKALDTPLAALRFRAITYLLLGFSLFLNTK